jgi:hypothetical protein
MPPNRAAAGLLAFAAPVNVATGGVGVREAMDTLVVGVVVTGGGAIVVTGMGVVSGIGVGVGVVSGIGVGVGVVSGIGVGVGVVSGIGVGVGVGVVDG